MRDDCEVDDDHMPERPSDRNYCKDVNGNKLCLITDSITCTWLYQDKNVNWFTIRLDPCSCTERDQWWPLILQRAPVLDSDVYKIAVVKRKLSDFRHTNGFSSLFSCFNGQNSVPSVPSRSSCRFKKRLFGWIIIYDGDSNHLWWASR